MFLFLNYQLIFIVYSQHMTYYMKMNIECILYSINLIKSAQLEQKPLSQFYIFHTIYSLPRLLICLVC